MSKSSKVQTDNSFFREKVALRIETLNNFDKNQITILECFAGDGLIWDEVKSKTDKILKILRIEQKQDKEGIYLKGDNLKFLKNINLEDFDIIDLDAYGSPLKQLQIVFQKKYTGIVHCTFIQSVMGRLPNEMLYAIGISKEMIRKCPTLFSKGGMEKMKNYLAVNGVKKISGYFIGRKNYFWFRL